MFGATLISNISFQDSNRERVVDSNRERVVEKRKEREPSVRRPSMAKTSSILKVDRQKRVSVDHKESPRKKVEAQSVLRDYIRGGSISKKVPNIDLHKLDNHSKTGPQKKVQNELSLVDNKKH